MERRAPQFPGRRSRSVLRLGTGLGVLLAVVVPRAEAWGVTGHRLVNRAAVEALPEPLRTFFAAHAEYLADHSIDPDLWREAGAPGEGPNHYLDLDAFGPPPFDVPLLEEEHLGRHGAAASEKGRVPWRAAEVYRDLVEAYRAKDPARILERSAVLGHYVADAHVPFHAALNYDGQLSGQKGIHARWESRLVERHASDLEKEVVAPPAWKVDDPAAFVLAVLRDSFGEVQGALDSDRESAAQAGDPAPYGETYYARLWALEGARLRRRLVASAADVGSLWYSAWVDAGEPPLGSPPGPSPHAP